MSTSSSNVECRQHRLLFQTNFWFLDVASVLVPLKVFQRKIKFFSKMQNLNKSRHWLTRKTMLPFKRRLLKKVSFVFSQKLNNLMAFYIYWNFKVVLKWYGKKITISYFKAYRVHFVASSRMAWGHWIMKCKKPEV